MTLFGNFLCLAPLYVKKVVPISPPLDGIEVCINVRIGKYFPERKRASKNEKSKKESENKKKRTFIEKLCKVLKLQICMQPQIIERVKVTVLDQYAAFHVRVRRSY